MYLSLNGNWTFKDASDNNWMPAKVPSCNYTDLLSLNKIPDPFIGLNEAKVLWVGEKDWIYRKEFKLEDDVAGAERVVLVCEMLDTLCKLTLNGVEIGNGQNSHINYRFDIKNAVKVGKNTLDILFYSPLQYINETKKSIKVFHNNNGITGDTLMRKAQCQFGWDWGPTLPCSGIPKNIGIEYGSSLHIDDIIIRQDHGKNLVTLNIEATLSGAKEGIGYTIAVTAPDGKLIEKHGASSGNDIHDSIAVAEPQLWWTHDMNGKSRQPLYHVTLTVGNGKRKDEITKRIGLRTLFLERVKDEYGTSFRFILNGVRTFAKGANWIPADSFEDRVTKEKLYYLIGSAQFSNMNMLRVWGGGFYGSEDFYNVCDELGIMVWQDCGFACQAYPLDNKEYMANCLDEIKSVARRIRSHPSLALWCGNNEVEHSNEWWLKVPAMKPYLKSAEEFFWHSLKAEIAKYDDVTSYIPGSPTGSEFMKEFADDTTGDTHLWQVWHGMQNPKYYRMRYTRFCSEFGFESLPDMKTIKEFAQGKDYDLNSKVFNAHQKCLSGNKKMVYYIRNRFRSPQKFEDFVYLSQLCQMECVRDATEFWRRNRHRCNGSLFWQINDCWPVCSWASIDYNGNYKALQYAARHFNAPISVSISDEKDTIGFYTVNDSLTPCDATLYYAFSDFENDIREEQTLPVHIEPIKATLATSVDMRAVKSKYNLKRTVLLAELRDANGNVINRKTVVFGFEKNLLLTPPKLSLKCELDGERIKITVNSEKFARLVRVENSKKTSPFSDNWFDLLPSESKVIYFPKYAGFAPSDFSVMSAADIKPACPRIVDDIKRLMFLLKPINLGVYLANYRRK